MSHLGLVIVVQDLLFGWRHVLKLDGGVAGHTMLCMWCSRSCVCVCLPFICVGVRGQVSGIGSLLPLWVLGIELRSSVWWQTLLSAESQPLKVYTWGLLTGALSHDHPMNFGLVPYDLITHGDEDREGTAEESSFSLFVFEFVMNGEVWTTIE